MAKDQFNLFDKSTHWVFIAGHCDEHDIYDLIFAIRVLKAVGVPPDKILTIISFQKEFSEEFFSSYPELIEQQFIYSGSFKKEQLPRGENFVITVMGHGSTSGIATTPTISPYALNSLIDDIPDAKCALVILGQCYAGIFNYLDVETKVKKCFIGATSLTTSSGIAQEFIPMEERLKEIVTSSFGDSWRPNFFIFQCFRWILLAEDIDGDGLYTATDMYKYVLISTEETLQKLRVKLAKKLFAENNSRNIPTTSEDSVDLQVANILRESALEKELEILFSEQAPWILNANFSRRLVFNPTASTNDVKNLP